MGRARAGRRDLALAIAIGGALAAPLSVVACGDDGAVTGGTGAGPTIDASGGGGDAPDGSRLDAGHHDAGRDAKTDHDPGDASDADIGDALPTVDAACKSVEAAFALEPGVHVPICSFITWSTNPPTSGEHYPIWAAFHAYDKPVPRGFSVHDLEHGGVVVSYNCPGGCDAEVGSLEAWLAARPADPACTAPVHARFVVTPDPLLDVRFAAASWGFSLRSDCFDLDALGAFVDQHYGHGTEDFCTDGIDPTAPDAGIPADCGQAPDGGPSDAAPIR